MNVNKKALKEILETMEEAKNFQGPYVFKVQDSNGEHTKITDRTEYLEFHLDIVIEALGELIGE